MYWGKANVPKKNGFWHKDNNRLETVSIAEPLQNRQHAQNP